MENIQEIMQFVSNNGLGLLMGVYFIYKDYKQSQQTIDVLGEIKEVLTELRTYHSMEREKQYDDL